MKYLVALLIFFSILLTPSKIFANSSPQPINEAQNTSTVTLDAVSLKMEYTILSLMHNLSCIATETPLLSKPCFSFAPLGSLTSYNYKETSGGLLGITNSALSALLTTPPIHTQQYVAHVSESFGLIPEANAQVGGTGGQVIDIMFNLWVVSRNFSYVLMTVIFIAIGFMVMFRQRINPQTVITVQAALPGLVVGLILITLSYFFAAILVDIGFAAVYIVGFYFMQTQPSTALNPTDGLIQENVLSIFSYFVNAVNNVDFAPSIDAVLNRIQDSAATTLDRLIRFISCEYSESVTSVVGGIPIAGPFLQVSGCLSAGEVAAANKGYFIGMIAWLALFFILLYTMLQLIRKLLMNYITILFLTFTAPFQFLAASLPGNDAIATNWVRNMLCNVLTFPSVFAVMYFAAYILSNGNSDIQLAFGIVDGPRSAIQSVPLFANLDSELVRYMIGFGALMAAPGIPDIICEAIGKQGRAAQIIAGQVEGNMKAGQGQLQQGVGFAKRIGGGLGGMVKGFASK